MFEAIHAGDADPKLLAYQYLQMLPQIAQGDANKVWIIPTEFTQALGQLGEAIKPSARAATHPRRRCRSPAHAAASLTGVFDSLSDRLQEALADVRSRGKLTEDDVTKAMRQVRLALLEADVNFKVVKEFTGAVKERAIGADVLDVAQPRPAGGQDRHRRAHRAHGRLGARSRVRPGNGPTVILMAGLQGSGKTTACGKLARHLREEKRLDVAVAACDLQRPAAVDQLVKVGAQAGATVYEQGTARSPVDVAEWALGQAKARPPRRADRRHRRPSARGRGADGRARRGQEARPSPTTCCSWWTR